MDTEQKIHFPMDSLPNDAIHHMFTFCDPTSLYNLVCTSKNFAEIFKDKSKRNFERVRLALLNKHDLPSDLVYDVFKPKSEYKIDKLFVDKFEDFLENFETLTPYNSVVNHIIRKAFKLNLSHKQQFVIMGSSITQSLKKRPSKEKKVKEKKEKMDEEEEEEREEQGEIDYESYIKRGVSIIRRGGRGGGGYSRGGIGSGGRGGSANRDNQSRFGSQGRNRRRGGRGGWGSYRDDSNEKKVENTDESHDYPVDYHVGDIDLFLIENGSSPEESEELLAELFKDIPKDVSEFIGVRISNLFNVISADNNVPLQIVTRRINSIEELLYFADLDITRYAYDGSTIFTTDEGMRALQYKLNILPKRLIDKDKITERVRKYRERGHDTIYYTLHPFEHEFRKNFKPLINAYKYDDFIPEKSSSEDEEYNPVKDDEDLFYSTFSNFTFEMLKDILDNGENVKRTYKKAFSKPFTISKTLDDLISLDSSKCYIEGLRDQQLWKKFYYTRCYLCNVYRKLGPGQKNTGICVSCTKLNNEHRKITRDLTGMNAIVTGGRIKIGYVTALMLLRNGANVVVTTRFIGDAKSKFEAEKDYNQWKKRLELYPLDLKSLDHVKEFVTYIKKSYTRIHILINNAAQTVRRPVQYYNELFKKEDKFVSSNESKQLVKVSTDILKITKSSLDITKKPVLPEDSKEVKIVGIDHFGELIEDRKKNSWTYSLPETNPLEVIETQMINSIAPSYIISEFYELMKIGQDKVRSHIINVTSHEGRFNVIGKTDYHVHNNMSKAAINMLTRSASHFYAKKGIIMNAVDPGWISSAYETFINPPLTVEDGACRILDPVFRDFRDYGNLYKDYVKAEW